MAVRIQVGFSLNNGPKQAENKSDCHHTDTLLQFMSVRPICKKNFPYIFPLFATELNDALGILNH